LASSLLFYGFDMPKGPRGEKRLADVIGATVIPTDGTSTVKRGSGLQIHDYSDRVPG
jgi:hypothetical protein